MKHTLGPWKPIFKFNKKSKFEHSESWQIMGRENAWFKIGTVDGPSNMESVVECHANAKLISAAPDLLSACNYAIILCGIKPRLITQKMLDDTKSVLQQIVQKATE